MEPHLGVIGGHRQMPINAFLMQSTTYSGFSEFDDSLYLLTLGILSTLTVSLRLMNPLRHHHHRLDDFPDDRPRVSREQAIELPERATALLVGDADEGIA